MSSTTARRRRPSGHGAIVPTRELKLIFLLLLSNRLCVAISEGQRGAKQTNEVLISEMAAPAFNSFNICAPARLTDLLPQLRRARRTLCKCTATPIRPAETISLPMETEHIPRLKKIACVGDIHGMWNEHDEAALRAFQPDLALFVGDYGDENVAVTQRVADFANSVDFGVSTVFGNHDAFYTVSSRKQSYAPYDVKTTCRVSDQIRMLDAFDVSYRSVAFDSIAMSVCGGRSFSHGGPNWKYKQFFRNFVGVSSMADSTAKLNDAVMRSQFDTLVFLSHSGPVGLGDGPEDPCGKDWGDHPGGDYGDVDLRAAIENARSRGMRVPLTVFGHMHKKLQGDRGNRIMVKTEPDGCSGGQTVMLNAAVVPRHKRGPLPNTSLHHFQIVYVHPGGDVDSIEESWLSPEGKVIQSSVIFKSKLTAGYQSISPVPMAEHT